MSKKKFKINCSKLLIIAHTVSLTPAFAMEDAANQSVGEQGIISEKNTSSNYENIEKEDPIVIEPTIKEPDIKEPVIEEPIIKEPIIDESIQDKETLEESKDVNLKEDSSKNETDKKEEASSNKDYISTEAKETEKDTSTLEVETLSDVALNGDTSLSRLGFINGISLTETFAKDKYEYEAILQSNRSAIQWGASFSSTETTVVSNNKSRITAYFNNELIKEDVTMLAGFSIPYIEDGENILKIVVTAENGDTATYTISFTRIKYSDAYLSKLKFINGIELAEEFNKDKFEYDAILSSNRSAIQWGASWSGNEITTVTSNVKSTMDVYFNEELIIENQTILAGFSIPYIEDGENVLKIVVKAENGDSNTYTITFKRIKYSDAYLARLKFLSGIELTEEFDKEKFNYEAIISSNRNAVQWGASFDGSSTTAVTSNVKSTMDVYWNDDLVKEDVTMIYNLSLPYNEDGENTLRIVVKAENGDSNTYTISFTRIKYSDAYLSRLKFLNGIDLTEEFDKEKFNYHAIIQSNRSAVQWGASFDGSSTTAVTSNVKSTMDVYWNDEKVKEDVTMIYNLSLPYNEDGENILKIVVKAENGDTNTYTISFHRESYTDTSLSRLNFINGINLTEEFNKDKYDYEAIIQSNRNAIQWGASFSGNETTAVNGNKAYMDVYFNDELIKEKITMLNNFSIPYIEDGKNVLKIVVTAENGDTATYTISFTRIKYSDTSLTRLNFLGGINLTENFDKDKYNYQAIVPGNTNSIRWGASFDSSSTTAVNNNKAVMDVYFNGDLIKEDITMLHGNIVLDLAKKTTNVLKIVVKAENGDTATYTIVFGREFDSSTTIKELSIDNASLDSDGHSYTANMEAWHGISLNQIVLEDSWAEYRAVLNDEVELEVNDEFDLGFGDNELNIEVTANDGTTKVYPVIFEKSDEESPVVSSSVNTKNWSKDDIEITIEGTDVSGIRYIELPNGEKIYDSSVKYYVNENKEYTFKVYDNFLNETIETITVDNVDKELPTLDLKASKTELTNQSIDILVEANDNIGVDYVETPDGEHIKETSFKYSIRKDGNYTFKVVDLAGNEVIKSININNIDSENPILTTELSNANWTNKDVTIKVSTLSDKGIKHIILPNGTKVKDTVADFKVTKNGTYAFVAESAGGNITREEVTISTIDKKAPQLTLTPSKKGWTNEDVKVSVSAKDNSKIDYIILPNGEKVYSENYIFTVKDNGTFEFIAVDVAGNKTSKTIKINNIDKNPPVIDNYEDVASVSDNIVTLDLSTIETTSGINKVILPNGEAIINPKDNIIEYEAKYNDNHRFVVVDNAGNSIDVKVNVESDNLMSKEEYIKKNTMPDTSGLNSMITTLSTCLMALGVYILNRRK